MSNAIRNIANMMNRTTEQLEYKLNILLVKEYKLRPFESPSMKYKTLLPIRESIHFLRNVLKMPEISGLPST